MSYETAAILNQNLTYIPHILNGSNAMVFIPACFSIQIIGYIGWALVWVTKFDAALTSKCRYLFWTFFSARITLKRVWVSDWRSKGGSYEGKELISWPFCCCHKFQRNVTRRELASLAQWVRFCGMGVQKLGSYSVLTKRKKEFCFG